MIKIKNQDEIEKIKVGGNICYKILMNLKNIIKEGMTTEDIDNYVSDYIKSTGNKASFLGYGGFPKSICASINDKVVHGIPNNKEVLKNGDIISIDIGVIYKGYNSDTAYTYVVGSTSKKVEKFINDTQKSLYEGLSVIKEGVKLNEVCKRIESVALKNNYGVIRELTGHGVGKELHEDPYIPNYSNHESEQLTLKAGMVLAIEPMFSLGSNKVWLLEDGWGISTIDGSLTAHFEHTVVVTKDGYEILTGE